MFNIFCRNTAKDYSAAAAAFSAVLSFEAQIDMVHSSIEHTMSADAGLYAEWKIIKKKLDKLRPARNRLAHGKVVIVTMKGGTNEWRYLPFYQFFTHKERDEFRHMTLSDLQAINTDFRGVVGAMSEFGKKIGARQEIKQGKVLTS